MSIDHGSHVNTIVNARMRFVAQLSAGVPPWLLEVPLALLLGLLVGEAPLTAPNGRSWCN